MVGGFLSVVVGLATIGAAVWAGKWAKAAAQHTQAGADEANRAANAAEVGNKQSDLIGKAQVRCYLTCAKASIGILDNGDILIYCTVKNSGQSPALNVTCRTTLNYFAKPVESVDAIRQNPAINRRNISANSEYDFSFGTYNFNLPNSMIINVVDHILITLKVDISGNDVFGETFTVSEKLTALSVGVPKGPKFIELVAGDDVIVQIAEA